MTINQILNQDVFREIFTHIDSPKTLAICERVCQLWQSIIKGDHNSLWKNLLFLTDARFAVQGQDPKISFRNLFGHSNLEKSDIQRQFSFIHRVNFHMKPTIINDKIFFASSTDHSLIHNGFKFQQRRQPHSNVEITDLRTNTSRTLAQSDEYFNAHSTVMVTSPSTGIAESYDTSSNLNVYTVTDTALIFINRGDFDPAHPFIVIQDINSGTEHPFGCASAAHNFHSKDLMRYTNNSLYLLDGISSLKKINLSTYTEEALPEAMTSRQFDRILFADDDKIVTLSSIHHQTLEPFYLHCKGDFWIVVEIWDVHSGNKKNFQFFYNCTGKITRTFPGNINVSEGYTPETFHYSEDRIILVNKRSNTISIYDESDEVSSENILFENSGRRNSSVLTHRSNYQKIKSCIFQKNICVLLVELQNECYGINIINIKENNLPKCSFEINSCTEPVISFSDVNRLLIKTFKNRETLFYTYSLLDFNPSASVPNINVPGFPARVISENIVNTYIPRISLFQKLYNFPISCFIFLKRIIQNFLNLFN